MADKPNIVVFWGDDIGVSNLSCYGDGVMGYRTWRAAFDYFATWTSS